MDMGQGMAAGIGMGVHADTTPQLSARAQGMINRDRTVKPNEAAARKAGEEFEAVILTTMLEGMFAGLKTEAPFGGGSAEKTYRSLLTAEYAKEISKTGGLGIADHVAREMLAIQEASNR